MSVIDGEPKLSSDPRDYDPALDVRLLAEESDRDASATANVMEPSPYHDQLGIVLKKEKRGRRQVLPVFPHAVEGKPHGKIRIGKDDIRETVSSRGFEGAELLIRDEVVPFAGHLVCAPHPLGTGELSIIYVQEPDSISAVPNSKG